MKKVIEYKQTTCTYFETHLNVERKNQMVNPTYVDFSIYPYCNLRCDFCYAEAECESTISNHLLKVSDFEDIFEQFDQIGILRVGFEGGEPFLRKDWFEILKLADKHYFNYFVNWQLWHTGSGCCCTSAKDTPSGAAAADPDADNTRPVPSCADSSQCSGCRWLPFCSESAPIPAC